MVPTFKTGDYEIRVYSGSSNGLASPIKNYTPFTLVDYRMKNLSEIKQELPFNYNGLVYVLKGSVKVGQQVIKAEQAGWLVGSKQPGDSELKFQAMDNNTHFVLYAGQPHNVPVIHHGPFVADTVEDISRLYKEFRNGLFPHLNNLPEAQKVNY